MKADKKIPFTTLIERLEKALNYPVGMNHLAILIHGWSKRHPEQAPLFSTLSMRKRKDGYPWLTETETHFLSRYAGYDLTKD